MIKFATHILFATDFSESSLAAFRYALDWAKALEANLTVLTVQALHPGLDMDASITQRYLDEQREVATAQLDILSAEARQQIPTATAHHMTGMPSEQICQFARDKNIDLIVMGTHGWSGIKRVLFGSVAERVIARAPCPVLTIPLRKPEEIANMHTLQVAPRQVVLPVDFSDCSMDAYEYAVQIAKWFDSSMTLVYAIEPFSYSLDFTLTHPLKDKGNRKKIEDRLTELTDVLTKEGMTAEFDLQDNPAKDAILEASITRQADLIVMGTHGRKGISRVVMGSITTKVLQESPYPVLTVKSPKFEGGHRATSMADRTTTA
jgi:nucleotide-binding universal stress UspA family protein